MGRKLFLQETDITESGMRTLRQAIQGSQLQELRVSRAGADINLVNGETAGGEADQHRDDVVSREVNLNLLKPKPFLATIDSMESGDEGNQHRDGVIKKGDRGVQEPPQKSM